MKENTRKENEEEKKKIKANKHNKVNEKKRIAEFCDK